MYAESRSCTTSAMTILYPNNLFKTPSFKLKLVFKINLSMTLKSFQKITIFYSNEKRYSTDLSLRLPGPEYPDQSPVFGTQTDVQTRDLPSVFFQLLLCKSMGRKQSKDAKSHIFVSVRTFHQKVMCIYQHCYKRTKFIEHFI